MKKKISKILAAAVVAGAMAIAPVTSVSATAYGFISRSISWSDWLQMRSKDFTRKGMDSWFTRTGQPVDFVYSLADLNGLRGDVNGDGTINAADIAKLTRVILEDEYNEYDVSCTWNRQYYCYTSTAFDADLNKDGSCDVCDLALLKQIILGTAKNPKAVSPESGAVPVFYFWNGR